MNSDPEYRWRARVLRYLEVIAGILVIDEHTLVHHLESFVKACVRFADSKLLLHTDRLQLARLSVSRHIGDDLHGSDVLWPSLCALAHTPRSLKHALRRAWQIWRNLPGEVDLLELLIWSLLREGCPGGYKFLKENLEALRHLPAGTSADEGKQEPVRRMRERIAELALLPQQKTALKVALTLFGFNVSIHNDESFYVRMLSDASQMGQDYPPASQTIALSSPTDYFRRIEAGELAADEVSDQEVISEIQTYVETRNDQLPHKVAEHSMWAKKVSQFESLVPTDRLIDLIEDHANASGRLLKGRAREESPGFMELCRLCRSRSGGHDLMRDRAESILLAALDHSLELAHAVHEQYVDDSVKMRIRDSWVSGLRQRIEASASYLSVALNPDYPYALYHTMRYRGDYLSYNTAQEWQWLAEHLCLSMESHPDEAVPDVAHLFIKDSQWLAGRAQTINERMMFLLSEAASLTTGTRWVHSELSSIRKNAEKRNNGENMQVTARLFNRIARSHMYWGRKPLVGLLQVLDDVDDGLVLDPFCGAGTPAVAALIGGARVITGDLNPMGPFLTRVLARPVSIPSLTAAFDQVRATLEASVSLAYAIRCPTCGSVAVADFVVWSGAPEKGRPIAAKIHCKSCGKLKVLPLDSREEARQKRLAKKRPTQPYPETPIHMVSRRSPVPTHDRLFTSRNLTLLADLLAAINSVESVPYREALQYVFTASLYSCSRMQMYSEKDPSSSRGWTALRYYIPPNRKETNVLHAFCRRFENFLSCKELLNEAIPAVRVTDRTSLFNKGSAELLVRQTGWRDCVKQFGQTASHVFLDPPYNADIDYFGFSEFWGSWLGMRFPFREEWHARRARGTKTEGLLMHVANSTPPGCRVVLALDPKDPKGWETEAAINASGYDVLTTGYFLYDQSNKAGRTTELLRRRDMYYVLQRAPTGRATRASKKKLRVEQPLDEDISPWVRAFACLPSNKNSNAAKLRLDGASGFVPSHLRSRWDDLETDDIDEWRANTKRNRSTYQSLCIALLALLLKQDGWTLRQTRKGEVERAIFELPRPLANSDPSEPAVAVFSSANNKHKMLVFFSEQGQPLLSKAAANIAKKDKNKFQRIAVLITATRLEMQDLRTVSVAKQWPRGFFLCLEGLRKRCAEVSPKSYEHILAHLTESPMAKALSKGSGHGIDTFSAEVLGNVQVGGEGSPYRKLQFEAPRLTGIAPGQFIMMDTWPRDSLDGVRAVPWHEFKTSFQEPSHTYLKRPFGVHRTFYPGFSGNYLKHLYLPRTLATIMHTVLPDRFDIFYKVLPNGKGTNEMKKLEKHMAVEMLGPLGRQFDIRAMVNEGVGAVHVIGGGVGMAPLIFLVQALRYFSVPVKAFIGIESISRLRYRQIDEAYAAGLKDVHIYADDLKQAGVECESIFVSYDKASDVRGIVPDGNHAKGLVSNLYARYLADHGSDNRVVAFACGPMPMMKAIYNLTKPVHIDLHVLMEKRMACGIGVCLSCVCRTKTGHSGYSRVCKDGPIFNANEIEWNE